MLTPSEIREKQFKAGLGFDKKEVESFCHELSSEFDALLQENTELKKKITELNENLTYYKSIEKTLQKALILAEKTAQDTRATALREADAIEHEAKVKAERMLGETKKKIEVMEHKTLNLMQQYDLFKIHFENLLHAQIELLNSRSFTVNTDDFSYKEPEESADSDKSHQMRPDTTGDEEAAISREEKDDDLEQLHFDFLKDAMNEKSYQTEDGFEFITMKD